MPYVPRGFYSQKLEQGTGVAAVINIGAPDAAMRLVLVSFSAKVLNAGAGINQPVVNIFDGATNVLRFPLWTNAAAGTIDRDEIARGDDDHPLWILQPGAALQVTFNVPPGANITQLIEVTGYPL